MSRTRIIIGAIISIAVFFAILPIAYWYAARALNLALGLPFPLMDWPTALILAGITWGVGLFWVLWSYSYLVFLGGGSPVEAFGVALEPTKQLVTTGPYAYVRNPMVFGFLIILMGVAFFENSWAGFMLFPIVTLFAVLNILLFEEKGLLKRFGAAYEHYRHHVPLLIPRLSPYIPEGTDV